MASIQKIGESYYCRFIYAGKRHTFTIGDLPHGEALEWQSRTETLLRRIKQGLVKPPEDPNQIADFMLHDGKVPETSTPSKKHVT